MHPSCQRDPVAIHMAQGFLYVAEHTYGTREGERHEPEIPKILVPVSDADMPLVGGGGGGKHSVVLTVSTNQYRST